MVRQVKLIEIKNRETSQTPYAQPSLAAFLCNIITTISASLSAARVRNNSVPAISQDNPGADEKETLTINYNSVYCVGTKSKEGE